MIDIYAYLKEEKLLNFLQRFAKKISDIREPKPLTIKYIPESDLPWGNSGVLIWVPGGKGLLKWVGGHQNDDFFHFLLMNNIPLVK